MKPARKDEVKITDISIGGVKFDMIRGPDHHGGVTVIGRDAGGVFGRNGHLVVYMPNERPTEEALRNLASAWAHLLPKLRQFAARFPKGDWYWSEGELAAAGVLDTPSGNFASYGGWRDTGRPVRASALLGRSRGQIVGTIGFFPKTQ